MSPKLKPLLLPQLVEERRKRESQATITSTTSTTSTGGIVPAPLASCQTVLSLTTTNADWNVRDALIIYTASSSHSDISSPVTPTFSQGHSRYASSTSSFEMLGPHIPDVVSSPAAVTHKPGKRNLPDVQEDPLEQDEDTILDEKLRLYDCLCDEDYCIHRHEPEIVASPLSAHSEDFADHYFGSGSDYDTSSSPRSLMNKIRKDASDSPLSGIARFGTRLPSLSRFKSSKRLNMPISPVSDLSLDSYPLSRDPSRSRSSSGSASGRYHLERSNDPPMPPTPALSFFDSSDSIGAPQPVDIDKANAHMSLERERSMATTPLLPPLMMEASPAPQQNHQNHQPRRQGLPNHLSTVSPQPARQADPTPAVLLPSPPLSSKPSVSELKLLHASEIPSIIQDAWTDRLGHANFTIMPRPYLPAQGDMEALRQLRADWDAARMAYGRHISRIGEHYGHTSKTYNLTEAKWCETQNEWQSLHNALVDQIADSANTQDQALQRVPIAVPKLHSMGNKFPNRGDEDIVGPMMRAVTMLPATGGEERKGARFWRNLAERVGLKR